MSIFNTILIIVIFVAAIMGILYYINKNKNAEVEQEVEKDDKTYTLDKMREFVKKRLDEITKVNLYDIGLSEEELKRRKNKKYALKKALKGCTYGDVNDKRYVKELIADLLSKEYGITMQNYNDTGTMLYNLQKQPVYAGASGPVCAPLVTYGYIFKEMQKKKLKRVLVVATGALMSPARVNEKESIPAIAHAVSLEAI